MKTVSNADRGTTSTRYGAYTVFDFRCSLCKRHVHYVRVHRLGVVPYLVTAECEHCHFQNRFGRALSGCTFVVGAEQPSMPAQEDQKDASQ